MEFQRNQWGKDANYVEASMVRSIVIIRAASSSNSRRGDSMGFPFGIQIVGRRYGDKALLEMAKLQSSLEMDLKISNPKPIIQFIEVRALCELDAVEARRLIGSKEIPLLNY